MKKRKLIYICSPCRGDYEANIDNAITYSGICFRAGYIPVTPHIYFTRFMNDNDIDERLDAMDAGMQLLLECSEVWVFGLDHPSEGMKAEIKVAKAHGIPIRDGEDVLREMHTMAELKRKVVTSENADPDHLAKFYGGRCPE